tara:strand:+ start:283 stop:588 length:306 start_codon:yes stop_codon:yes gene_type:complete
MAYRPLPDTLTVKKSPIEGLGVFALCDIALGTELGVAHVNIVDFPQDYCRTPLGGFYNHSDEPNCKLIDDHIGFLSVKRLVTIKDVKQGDEITCQYTLYKV